MKLSPDGERLAFVVEDLGEGNAGIMVIPVTGGEPKELYEGHPTDITWTPDRHYLLFVMREEKGSAVWRISSKGGDPEVIWKSKDFVTGLSIHPNEKEIAVSTFVQEQTIWVMENFLPKTENAK